MFERYDVKGVNITLPLLYICITCSYFHDFIHFHKTQGIFDVSRVIQVNINMYLQRGGWEEGKEEGEEVGGRIYTREENLCIQQS